MRTGTIVSVQGEPDAVGARSRIARNHDSGQCSFKDLDEPGKGTVPLGVPNKESAARILVPGLEFRVYAARVRFVRISRVNRTAT
jgi:hypothetical protein